MRLSTKIGDDGFEPWCELLRARRTARVYLDGREIEHWITADNERGEVTVRELRGDWRRRMWATTVHRGNVSIWIPKPEAEPAKRPGEPVLLITKQQLDDYTSVVLDGDNETATGEAMPLPESVTCQTCRHLDRGWGDHCMALNVDVEAEFGCRRWERIVP